MPIDYVTRVTEQIEDGRAREEIADELRAHILDKADAYREMGYDDETALARAQEDMGDPEEAAAPLNALHTHSPVTLFTGICLGAELLYTVLFVLLREHLAYSFTYVLGDRSVAAELVSALATLGFALILALAIKRRDKIAALSVSVVLLLIPFVVISGLTREILETGGTALDYGFGQFLFEATAAAFSAAAYFLFSLFAAGVPSEMHAVFERGVVYAPDSVKVISFILTLLFVALSVTTFAVLRCEERRKPVRRLKRLLQMTLRVLCGAGLALTAVILAVIAAAYIVTGTGAERAQLERSQMLRTVVDSDDDLSGFEDTVQTYRDAGYAVDGDDYGNLTLMRDGVLGNTLTVNKTTFVTTFGRDDIGWQIGYEYDYAYPCFPARVSGMEIENTLLERAATGMTLGEFQSLGYFDRAYSASRTEEFLTLSYLCREDGEIYHHMTYLFNGESGEWLLEDITYDD